MNSRHTLSLREMLAIEDDAELSSVLCKGTALPAWGLIRAPFLRTIMSDLLYGSPIGGGQTPNVFGKLDVLRRAWLHNRAHHHSWPSEICVMVTGWGGTQRDGKVFDRLGGYFAQEYSLKTLMLNEQASWKSYDKLHYERTLFASPVNIYRALLSRIRVNQTHESAAAKVIELAAERARKILAWEPQPGQLPHLTRTLARSIAVLPNMIDYYATWFAANRTRLLLKEDGCFGHSSAVIVGAKRAGVVTAEFQHGAVSAGHDAYNVATNLAANSGYRDSLPEYFLSYGEWWSRQMSIPVKTVAIGNPHRSAMLSGRPSKKVEQTDILILGDGIDTLLYLNLCKEVVRIVQSRGFRTVFRPHPFERARVTQHDLPDGCVLDPHSDIYDSFVTADAVISEVSTGLFESIGLAKRAIVWETDKARFAFPDLPFPSFASVEKLEHLLSDTALRSAQGDITPDAIWAPNWQSNYRHFVEQALSK